MTYLLDTNVCIRLLNNSSSAIVNDLILITHNVKEFSRIENLKYQDWEIELQEKD